MPTPARFRQALRRILETLELTPAKVAREAGISKSAMHAYLEGISGISTRKLGQLLEVIPPAHHSTLIEAYLLDNRPENYEHLVSISPAASGIVEDPEPVDFGEIPPGTKEALRKLVHYSVHYSEVRDTIESLAHALTILDKRR